MPEAGRELKLRQRRDSANILGGLALGYLHTMIAKSLSYRTCIAGSIEIKKKKDITFWKYLPVSQAKTTLSYSLFLFPHYDHYMLLLPSRVMKRS